MRRLRHERAYMSLSIKPWCCLIPWRRGKESSANSDIYFTWIKGAKTGKTRLGIKLSQIKWNNDKKYWLTGERERIEIGWDQWVGLSLHLIQLLQEMKRLMIKSTPLLCLCCSRFLCESEVTTKSDVIMRSTSDYWIVRLVKPTKNLNTFPFIKVWRLVWTGLNGFRWLNTLFSRSSGCRLTIGFDSSKGECKSDPTRSTIPSLDK